MNDNKMNNGNQYNVTNNSADDLIGPIDPGVQDIDTLHGGGGRGFERNVQTIADFNRNSTRFRIRPTVADSSPGRAAAVARLAKERGLDVRPVEARVQDVVMRDTESTAPLVLQIDDAGETSRVLDVTADTSRWTLTYMMIKRTPADLSAARSALPPGPSENRRLWSLFHARLDTLTLRRGSRAMLGPEGAPEDIANEPMYRAWMAQHFVECLPKIVAGLTPSCDVFEITDDGTTTRPLILVEATTPSDPAKLAADVLARPGTPVARGSDFVVAEILPSEIRFMTVRLRRTDGRVSVQGSVVLDRASRDAAEAEEQRVADARRAASMELARTSSFELDRAIERAARQIASRTNPVLITD